MSYIQMNNKNKNHGFTRGFLGESIEDLIFGM